MMMLTGLISASDPWKDVPFLKIFLLIWIQLNSDIHCQDISFPNISFGACQMTSGRLGWCRDVRSCRPVSANISITGRSSCGFRGKIPLVCCPLFVDLLTENNGDKVALLKDLSPMAPPNITFECGKRHFVQFVLPPLVKRVKSSQKDQNHFPNSSGPEDIVKFSPKSIRAITSSWPWMVLIGRRSGTEEEFFCSGVLINQNYVLTSVHCVLSLDPFFIRLGIQDHNHEVNEKGQPEISEDVEVSDVIIHPQYDPNKKIHNIALIKMAETKSFGKSFSPICLPWGNQNEDIVNEKVILIEQGRNEFNEYPSSILEEVNATVVDPSVCENSYSTLRDYQHAFPDGMNKGNIVCAEHEEDEKRACEDATSGAMMHYRQKDDSFTLAGIICPSYGCELEDAPSLYSPIRNRETLRWIKNEAF